MHGGSSQGSAEEKLEGTYKGQERKVCLLSSVWTVESSGHRWELKGGGMGKRKGTPGGEVAQEEVKCK